MNYKWLQSTHDKTIWSTETLLGDPTTSQLAIQCPLALLGLMQRGINRSIENCEKVIGLSRPVDDKHRVTVLETIRIEANLLIFDIEFEQGLKSETAQKIIEPVIKALNSFLQMASNFAQSNNQYKPWTCRQAKRILQILDDIIAIAQADLSLQIALGIHSKKSPSQENLKILFDKRNHLLRFLGRNDLSFTRDEENSAFARYYKIHVADVAAAELYNSLAALAPPSTSTPSTSDHGDQRLHTDASESDSGSEGETRLRNQGQEVSRGAALIHTPSDHAPSADNESEDGWQVVTYKNNQVQRKRTPNKRDQSHTKAESVQTASNVSFFKPPETREVVVAVPRYDLSQFWFNDFYAFDQWQCLSHFRQFIEVVPVEYWCYYLTKDQIDKLSQYAEQKPNFSDTPRLT